MENRPGEIQSGENKPRPVVLCILDGWGQGESGENNAILEGSTPTLNQLYATCPHSLIDASEHEVGLPDGQMGNSEVGHMNLGAGRIVVQDLPRIDAAIADGTLAESPALARFIDKLKATGGTAHILGLLSPGGVHAHQNHIAALAKILDQAGVPLAIHAFLDGRDTPPRSAVDFLQQFQSDAPYAPVATVTGRYYAMDRDKRWDRINLAYDCLVDGPVDSGGETAPEPIAAISQSYDAGAGDEFVKPTVIGAYRGMADGDGVLMANFRADRARELLQALLDPNFDENAGFRRKRVVRFAAATGMVDYGSSVSPFMEPVFPPLDLEDTLGEVVAEAGLKQLRLAETEKYAHVTFFFNGGRETEFPGEERILVPSPKVATYDLKPEMSAPELTDKLVAAIEGNRFDLIIVNYANGDMVGHTGNMAAAIRAVETVDRCLHRLSAAVASSGGSLLVTADHGNAEQMTDGSTGQAHTAHTMNKVPAILFNGPARASALAAGRLADIAPTILDLMGLAQPEAMTGQSLIRPVQAPRGTAA